MLKQVGFYIGSLTAIFIYNIAKVSLNSVFTFQVFTIYISSIVYRVQISYYISSNLLNYFSFIYRYIQNFEKCYPGLSHTPSWLHIFIIYIINIYILYLYIL